MEVENLVNLTESQEEDDLISRSYQTELEDIAFTKNTIIHLPTGSGKTFIAIHLINRFRDSLKAPWGEGGKRTFFLVNTVPLVEQQKRVISAICAVKSVAGYSGEDGVDYWDKSKWDKELSDHQVVVMTSQILADMLTHGYIRVEDINLLIFDECHHAVTDHPMRAIMKHFENCPVDKQPRILGLTATLLNGNVTVNKVENILRELEKTFRATIAMSNEMDVVFSYSTNPREVRHIYKESPPTQASLEAIEILTELQGLIQMQTIPPVAGDRNIKLRKGEKDITNDPKKIIKAVYNMAVHMVNYIKELGVYGGALGVLAYIILLERLKRRANSAEEENLYQFTITHSMVARAILLKSMKHEDGFEQIAKHSSDKVLKLLRVLKEYNPDLMDTPGVASRINTTGKSLSGIIFTKQRFTAKILYNLLKDVREANPAEYGFLKHEFIVGFNINPMKSTREDYYNKKCSEKALLKFKKKELNLLIATSVIEEGVDIPQCLLVVKYDLPMEYRSYIQSKGRARSNLSTYVMLISDTEQDRFMKTYAGYQKVESFIQELLVGKTDDRDGPSEEEISEVYDDEIPPYVTEHGARLLPVSAISLLNRYCSVLPHDQFTCISPMWVLENVTVDGVSMKVIHIYMPVSCPIKERISGIPQLQMKSAKRSAALNAVIRLHQEGELDEITLLPIKYGAVDFDDEDVIKCFPNWRNEKILEDMPKPGTKKMMRKHEKVFPQLLDGPKDWISGNRPFYLHVIKFETSFQVPTDTREQACYELLHKDEGFGFLTANALPKLCDFPMFVMMGEIKTSIKVNYAVIPLDKDLFDLVKYFHYFLFDQVLGVAKKFVVFDGTKNAMYVVPLRAQDGYDIDWDVMMTHREIPPLAQPSVEERKNLIVRPEEYDRHIVSPWYRGTILPTRYVVSRVLEYKTPQSLFDSDSPSLGTFEDYYLNKYSQEIFGDKGQPLLEVRHLSSKMNCLFPRSATIKEFTDRQRKLISSAHGEDAVKQFPELFIPEFCIKYEFPAVLWYKATILPCIVHRVTMLLVAYELRAEIAKDTKYGEVFLKPDEEWQPITVDMQVAIKSMLSQVEDKVPLNNIDRINDPIDESIPAPKIVSMKETIYQLEEQKINEDYPWAEQSEPLDIERNLRTVTVMDIECYDEFVSLPMKSKVQVEMVRPPRVEVTGTGAAAICAPPASQTGNIAILSLLPKGRGPELKDVLAAITTIKSHDTFNLERAETLGDSFLKFIASLYLFHKFPRLNEGQLTNIKGRLIGNRNLYYAGESIRLAGRMKVEQFSPRKDFLVPGFFAHKSLKEAMEQQEIRPTALIGLHVSPEEALSGEITEATLTSATQRFTADIEKEPWYSVQNSMQCYIGAQAVQDKVVADCVEALLGTYLQAGGVLAGIKVLEFFRVLPKVDNVSAMLQKKVPTAISENKTTVQEVYRVMNDRHEEVEDIMQYKFKDPSLLLEALSHPSYIRNRLTRGYERLEFLGDAILDFLVTAHIFELGQGLKPGELTDLRSALVNNVTFASYVVKLGLHKCICTQLNTALERAIITFVEHQQRRQHALEEDVLHLIDEADCQVAEYVEVPKLLSDVFESLAAAIYLDSGGNLKAVWNVYYKIMRNDINKFFACIPKQPVRLLYENIHACPTFGQPLTINPDIQKIMVPVTFTKDGVRHTVHGVGNNKFEAKRAAAKIALKVLSL